MTRQEEFTKIFESVDEDERDLVAPLIDEVIFLEEQLTELKKLPFISVHPKNPAIQKKTEAAKLYKECSQSYMNAIRILCSIIHKVDTSAQDELLKKLEAFNK